MMTAIVSAAAVYEMQRDRDMAWSRAAGCGDPAVLTPAERAYQREMVAAYELIDEELRAARTEIGGRVYRVPDANLDGLAARVAKINRRAEKLRKRPQVVKSDVERIEPVHFAVTDETWIRERLHEITGEVVEIIPHTFVVVGSQVVRMAGWCFAATIEHDEEGNIIRQVPGVEADLRAYRTAQPWCFHCQTVRRRIDTFVVLHEDGRTEQVGRNCLVDFLGASAKYAAQQAEWLRELADALDDAENDGMRAGGGIETTSLVEYLTHVALMVRTNKWTSRGTAREYGGTATADIAEGNMRDCRKKGYREPGPKEWHVLPEAQDAEMAEAAIVWAREEYGSKAIDDRDDFEHNMAVALAHDYLPTRRTGLAAYAVQAYRKSIEEEVRKAAVAESQFVGTVGKRETFTVTVARVVPIADRYSWDGGSKPLYLFVDGDGNSIKWFASTWVGLTEGETYELKGTVKTHDDSEEYGRCTVITRGKLIEAKS